jgi:putative spermidine/putrescine transport system permease protein
MARLWLYVLVALVLLFLLTPSLIVVPMSFSASSFLEFPPRAWSLRWYNAYFGSPEWMRATWVSAKVAFTTVLLSVPIGVSAAYGLSLMRSRLGGVLTALIVLPTLIPHVLVGIGLFFAYARTGLLNSITGLVIGHTLMALPFVFVVMMASFRSYDFDHERAAMSLGATRLYAFCTVTLPQVRFALITSSLLAFIVSLDEVLISLLVATGHNSTLTRRMFLALSDTIDPTIAAISSCLIGITVIVLLASQFLGHRWVGR